MMRVAQQKGGLEHMYPFAISRVPAEATVSPLELDIQHVFVFLIPS
jgi:hypothetical protein